MTAHNLRSQSQAHFSSRTLPKASLAFLLVILAQLLAASVFVAMPEATNAAPAAAIPDTDVNPYGVNTFFSKEVEDWKKERTMQMIQQGGMGWIKQEFEWDQIEFKKGYFTDDKFKKSAWQKYDQIVDLAAKYNVKIVARVDRAPEWARPAKSNAGAPPQNYQDYADFVAAFVQHYKGKISYLQLWNEPNLHDEWLEGTPVDPKKYTALLKAGYEAAKKADPSIRVMSAPLAMNVENFPDRRNLSELIFLEEMYQAGAKNYFDILPANGYGLEFAPEAKPDPKVLNFRRVELLHDIMVKYGDTNKAVWFNEYGWNASPATFSPDKLIWRRVTEQQQADYTTQGIKYARQNWPWAGVVFIWYFRQVGDIPKERSDYYFQMVTPEFEPKPVYNAVKKDALALLVQQGKPTPAPITPASAPKPTSTGAAGAGTAIPTAGTTPGANPAATVFPTAPGSSPIAVTQTAEAGPTVTPAPTSAPTVAPTVPATVVAAVATPVANAGTSTNSGTSEGGSIIPIIIGGLLVVGAGGGLAYYLINQSRRRP